MSVKNAKMSSLSDKLEVKIENVVKDLDEVIEEEKVAKITKKKSK